MFRSMILAALAVALPALGLADPAPTGTVTILEGDAAVLRGPSRLQAIEGLRLAPGDILETAPSAFAQVEMADRSVAQFGGGTRVMFAEAGAKAKPERWLYLMNGWAKLTGVAEPAGGGPAFDLRTPHVEMPAGPAVVVLRQSPSAFELFVERGEVRIGERQAKAPPTPRALKSGNFYHRKTGEQGAIAASASRGFVSDMPRFFRDSLPTRADRYRDASVKPKVVSDLAYADVEAWLKAEPSVRRPLMQRWRAKAREPAFRAALVANLPAHPEWDPILFPEKYRPKEPVVRQAAPPARSASVAMSGTGQ
jgi:hypothetical protein